MRTFPADRFVVESPVGADETLRRIRDVTMLPLTRITVKQLFAPRPRAAVFIGVFDGMSFRVRCVSTHRGSARPELFATIRTAGATCVVDVSARLPREERTMLVTLAASAAMFAVTSLYLLTRGESDPRLVLFYVTIAIFPIGLAWTGFKSGVAAARTALQTVLDAPDADSARTPS